MMSPPERRIRVKCNYCGKGNAVSWIDEYGSCRQCGGDMEEQHNEIVESIRKRLQEVIHEKALPEFNEWDFRGVRENGKKKERRAGWIGGLVAAFGVLYYLLVNYMVFSS